MSNNPDIPIKWLEILTELQQHAPDAILAGGAIRDVFYGKEAKDLDFFCKIPASIPPQWGVWEEGEIDYEGMEYIEAVLTYRFFDLPVNLIYVKPVDPIILLESFDLGICQIGFNGIEIIKSAAFDWDFKHGIITMRHIDRYRRSIQRYCRINQRYDLELAIPQLDELVTKKDIL